MARRLRLFRRSPDASTRQAGRPHLTALHIFVVTLRCEHSCLYCQVSRASEDRAAFDMTEAIAARAIDRMMESPSPHLKVEFQGGEPLLNFPLIRYIVSRVQERKGNRAVQFIITSNLACLTDEILDFCLHHEILFSTSLDGPASLHNANRPRPGQDSHAKAVAGIERVRKRLGPGAVSALMTTTQASLTQPEAIVDEYVRLGFSEIFLRPISPYGFAVKTASRLGYEGKQFLDFYRRGLTYILALNRKGIPFRETYATLLLRRMLTPYADGYVDLQSPAGLGLSVLTYNYDGAVYASDEGRMLAEMEDTTFRLGHVNNTSYRELIERLLPLLSETMTEGTPGCTDCAFQPWCGSDPVFHHRTQGDWVGHRPTSAFCERQMGRIGRTPFYVVLPASLTLGWSAGRVFRDDDRPAEGPIRVHVVREELRVGVADVLGEGDRTPPPRAAPAPARSSRRASATAGGRAALA